MTQPSEEEPNQKLLHELSSQDWEDRRRALKSLTDEQLKNDRILAAVKVIADQDPIPTCQNTARIILGLPATPTAENNNRPVTEQKPLGFLAYLSIGTLGGAILGLVLLPGLYDLAFYHQIHYGNGGDEGLSIFVGPVGAVLGALIGMFVAFIAYLSKRK